MSGRAGITECSGVEKHSGDGTGNIPAGILSRTGVLFGLTRPTSERMAPEETGAILLGMGMPEGTGNIPEGILSRTGVL